MNSRAIGRVSGTTRSRVPLVTTGALILAALCDLPTRIAFGQVTLSSLATMLLAILCLVSLPALAAIPVVRFGAIGWVWVFVGWAAFSSAIKGLDLDGVQNLAVYVIFAGTATCTAAWCDDEAAERVTHWLHTAGWAVAAAYAASLVLDGNGSASILGRRSFGLEALVFMAVAVPDARRSRAARLLPWVLFVLVVLSLSRTATVVAALLLVARLVHTSQGRRLRRAVVPSVVAGAGMVWAAFHVTAISTRVFGGDKAYQLGSLSINTEGRNKLWAVIIDDIGSSPTLGHGAGAASARIDRFYPGLGHPHNDYLRVVYDFGYVGLVLFAVAYLVLMLTAASRARRAVALAKAAPHTAALVALLAIAIGMITDNVLIYAFVMAPAGVLVGLSLRPPGEAPPLFSDERALRITDRAR
jgi:O-antigen ligase